MAEYKTYNLVTEGKPTTHIEPIEELPFIHPKPEYSTNPETIDLGTGTGTVTGTRPTNTGERLIPEEYPGIKNYSDVVIKTENRYVKYGIIAAIVFILILIFK